MIHVRGLSKKFQATEVLHDISFDVSKGEVVGFLGPNAAGKTTTMRILTGFLSPTSGTISVAGFDLENDLLKIRKMIGYLPENNPLYGELKVYEALNFVAGTKNITPYSEQYKNIVKTCGLKDVITKQISELSKGYRQRVGLAQALMGNPDILILDEPTSGLDPNQIQEIRGVIKKIGETKTIILSTHILQEVSAMCNRAIIIHKGRIVAQGTVEELTELQAGKDKVSILIEAPKHEMTIAVRSIHSDIEIIEMGSEGNAHRMHILGPKTLDLRRMIFQKAIQNQWVLLEMAREQENLENVFHNLTTNQ